MRHILKHHWSRHKHHFGLWALSGLILLASTLWLKHLPSVSTISPGTSLPTVSAQSKSVFPSILQKAKTSLPASSAQNEVIIASSTSSPPSSSTAPAAIPDQSLIEATFEFIASPGVTSTFTARVPEGANVYEAMKALSAGALARFEFKEYAGLGAMLLSVNGVANDARAGKFWIYYRNGAVAPVGISSMRVAPGDVITWRYE